MISKTIACFHPHSRTMPRQFQAGLGAAIVAVAAMLYCASAVDTTGMTVHGFKYVSNVEGYVNMTMDYCEIKAMLEGGNWTGAVDLFYNGKNSMRGATFRTFYAWGSDNHTGEPFFDKYRAGQGLEQYTIMFEEAVNSSNVPGAMKVLDAIRFQYMMHEWDEAVEKTENGLSSDASGAPHNLDEAWAMYAGDELCSGATAAAQAGALGRAMATQYMDGYDSLVNMAVLLAFRDAQYGAQNNITEWVESAYQTVLEQYAIMLLQNLYLDAYAATKARNCNKDVAMRSMQSMQGTWSMLQPLLKVLDAPEDTLAAMDKAVMSGKPLLKPIQKAISDLKIRSWFIGYPTKRWSKEQLPGCF